MLKGQDKKANTLVVEHISSTDISTLGNDYSSPSSDLDFNSGDFRSLPVESSSNLFLEEKVSHRLKGHDEKVKDVAENVSCQLKFPPWKVQASILISTLMKTAACL